MQPAGCNFTFQASALPQPCGLYFSVPPSCGCHMPCTLSKHSRRLLPPSFPLPPSLLPFLAPSLLPSIPLSFYFHGFLELTGKPVPPLHHVEGAVVLTCPRVCLPQVAFTLGLTNSFLPTVAPPASLVQGIPEFPALLCSLSLPGVCFCLGAHSSSLPGLTARTCVLVQGSAPANILWFSCLVWFCLVLFAFCLDKDLL